MPSPSFDREAIEAEIDRVRSLGLDGLRARGARRSAPPHRQPSPRISSRGSSAGTSRSRRWAGWIRKPQGISPAAHGATGHEPIALGASRPAPCSFANTKASGTPSQSLQMALSGARPPMPASPPRAITGTNWNGPRFFGLRIDRETIVLPDAADVPPAAPNGRPPARTAGIKSRRTPGIQRSTGNAAPARPSLAEREPRS
jgi:hypothetical protein